MVSVQETLSSDRISDCKMMHSPGTPEGRSFLLSAKGSTRRHGSPYSFLILKFPSKASLDATNVETQRSQAVYLHHTSKRWCQILNLVLLGPYIVTSHSSDSWGSSTSKGTFTVPNDGAWALPSTTVASVSRAQPHLIPCFSLIPAGNVVQEGKAH